ncbi:hypothetical protein FRB93_008525 [Tulasnella sp. JGI-2019a]|nr:hypothetical protein FRB93_008525 [Tulasnella sp. JGI-2019a]
MSRYNIASLSEQLNLGEPKLYFGSGIGPDEDAKQFDIFSNVHRSPVEDMFCSEDSHDPQTITTPTTSTTASSSSATSFVTDQSRASSSCSTPDAILLPAGHGNGLGSDGDTAHIGVGGEREQSALGTVTDGTLDFDFHGAGDHVGHISNTGNSDNTSRQQPGQVQSSHHGNNAHSDLFSSVNSTKTEESPFAWSSSPLMGASFNDFADTTGQESTSSSTMPISTPMLPPPPRRTTSEYTVQRLQQHQSHGVDPCFAASSTSPDDRSDPRADRAPSFDELVNMGLTGGIAVPLYGDYNPCQSSVQQRLHQAQPSPSCGLPTSGNASSSGSTIVLPSVLNPPSSASTRDASPISVDSSRPNTTGHAASETSSMTTTTPPNTAEMRTFRIHDGPSAIHASPSTTSLSDTTKSTSAQKRGHKLPKHVTDFFRAWIYRNVKNPYPSDEEKEEFARRTGLKANQVANWFINARRRLLAPSRHAKGTAASSAPYDMSEVATRNTRTTSNPNIAQLQQQKVSSSSQSEPQQRPKAPTRSRSDYVVGGSRVGPSGMVELQLPRSDYNSPPASTSPQRSGSGHGHPSEADPFTRLGKPSPAFLAIPNSGMGSMRSVRGVERSNSSSSHNRNAAHAMSMSPTASTFPVGMSPTAATLSDAEMMFGMPRHTPTTPSSGTSPAPFWALQNASVLRSSGARSSNAGLPSPSGSFDFSGQHQQPPWNVSPGSYQHQWEQLQSVHQPNLLGGSVQQHLQQYTQNQQRPMFDQQQQQQSQYAFNPSQQQHRWNGSMNSEFGQSQPPPSASNRDFL